MSKTYETVIGLEVHVELATKTKIFCGCSTAFGGAPNTHTCPVCTGMPGSLPVLNKAVVEKAVAVGLATNCTITQNCKFDRKNYFYPDNPQNYQISQLYLPICHDGWVEIDTAAGKKKIGIHEIHMEEDAGKLVHDEWEDCSLVDYNRSGVPLIEIVTKPIEGAGDRAPEIAGAYMRAIRDIVRALNISHARMEQGNMRADVNVSLRPSADAPYGTRSETKNVNSFRGIEKTIQYEIRRQAARLDDGKEILQETRHWDEATQTTAGGRLKSDADDYRYFPDPDLVPVMISDEWMEEIRSRQPELRDEKRIRYKEEYDIPDYDIDILTNSKKLADIFEEAIALGAAPKKVSNWLMVETMRLMKEASIDADDLKFSAKNLAAIIKMVDDKVINGTVAKEVFEKVFAEDIDPEAYVEEHGLKTVNDEGALRTVILDVIEKNPKSVADFKGGKEKAIGALVGQTMKAMQGKADPSEVNRILREELSK